MMSDFEIVAGLTGVWCMIGSILTMLLIAVCWIAVHIVRAVYAGLRKLRERLGLSRAVRGTRGYAT